MYVYIVQNRIWILTDVLFSSFKNQERSWRKNCSYDLELAFFLFLLSSSRKANDKSNLSNFLLWLLFLEGKSSHSAPTTATKCFVKRIPLSKMALRETIPNPASIHTSPVDNFDVSPKFVICVYNKQTVCKLSLIRKKYRYICIIKPNESERTSKIFCTMVIVG